MATVASTTAGTISSFAAPSQAPFAPAVPSATNNARGSTHGARISPVMSRP
jgi:hypothetical protein